MNGSNEKEKNNKKLFPVIVVLVVILTIITVSTVIISVSRAKYVSYVERDGNAKVARMACSMSVKSSSEDDNGKVINPADKSIINPYCIVTVKNFVGDDENKPERVSETGVIYTVNVRPKKDDNGQDSFILPAYYWYEISSPDDVNGVKVAVSTGLESKNTTKGAFKKDVAETRYYKVVFLNSGVRDITRYVDFELEAVQDQSDL